VGREDLRVGKMFKDTVIITFVNTTYMDVGFTRVVIFGRFLSERKLVCALKLGTICLFVGNHFLWTL